MSSADTYSRISNAIPGEYVFDLSAYEQPSAFLSDFRRYEGLAKARNYRFEPVLTHEGDVPYEGFKLTVVRQPFEGPFEAISMRKPNFARA